jgi:hypothetical protein
MYLNILNCGVGVNLFVKSIPVDLPLNASKIAGGSFFLSLQAKRKTSSHVNGKNFFMHLTEVLLPGLCFDAQPVLGIFEGFIIQ